MARTNVRTEESQSTKSNPPIIDTVRTDQSAEEVSRFETTENGQTVSMEIRPKTNSLSDQIVGAIARLDERISKAPAVPVNIESNDEYVAAFERIKAEKEDIAYVDEVLSPYKAMAHRIHSAISAKMNLYAGYCKARIEEDDRAIVKFDDERQREQEDTKEAMEAQAIEDEQDRRAEEVKTLKARGDVQGAKERAAAPLPNVAVHVEKTTPKVAGGSVHEKYVAECVDEDKLIAGIARREIYREVAVWIATLKFPGTTKQTKAIVRMIADAIAAHGKSFPEIPTGIMMSTKGARDSVNSRLTAIANSTNGKIAHWPGVAVETEKKARTRR